MSFWKWLRRPNGDHELDEEIRSHLRMATRDRIDRGESTDEARHSALREFGNVALVQEVTREVSRWMWLERLGQDLRYSLRVLRKSPGFTAVAVVTLALGIGANSGIFTVVNAVLLKSLPYPHADRLVFLGESLPKFPMVNVSWPDFVDWKAQNQVFDRMAAFQPNRLRFRGSAEPKMIRVAWVSASFFPLLGARPILGRTFNEEEDKPGGADGVVLSYSLWRSDLKSDPEIVGKTVEIGNGTAVVLGVLDPDFQFRPWEFTMYLPIGPRSTDPSWNRSNHPGLMALASLRPEISLERARADMNAIMDRLARDYPESNRNEKATVTPLMEQLVGNVRTELLLLLGAVGFVLLMASTNVAHLALARAATRQREFAIRAALGAGRARLVRQLIAECSVLSLMGGAAGLLLAIWSVPPLARLYPSAIPGLKEARVDSGVLLFTLGICAVAGVLFGMAPMMQAARPQLNLALKEGGGGVGKPGQRLRSMLFVAEIAIALVLTVGAGLLLRSLAAVLDVNPGFRPDHLLALDVVRAAGPVQARRFFEQALDRVSHVPGVQSASAVMCPPLAGTSWTSPYVPDGQAAPPAMQRPWTALNMVMPGYFQTMQTPLLEGRLFSESDGHGGPVAIVSQSMARRLWPEGGAPGKRLHVQYAAGELLEVVGVVADMKQVSLESRNIPEVYVPAAQMPVNFMTIVVRTSVDPNAVVRAATLAIQSVDPDQPVSKITPMTESIAVSLARRKFAAFLLGLFGALALALAAVGVGGVMAYTVAQRTREIGIRMALGAQRGQVLREVLGRGLRLAALGVAIGLGAAWMLTRLLRGMLFGVKSHDAPTFAAMAALLAAVALGACLLPARRASRVDPMTALRYE